MNDADTSLRARAVAVLRAAYLGAAGFVALFVWAQLLFLMLTSVGLAPGPIGRQAVSSVALGLGTATVVYFFVRWTDREWTYVDVRWPTRRDAGYAVGGGVLLLALLWAVSHLFAAAGVSTAQHGIEQAARSTPAILLALVPLSFLFVGPGEELLYRNVVQKSLVGAFSRRGAVVVASAVFALAHVPAYATGSSPTSLVATLGVVFALSLVLGAVYDRTGNVLVPAFAHAVFDAVQYVALYLQLVGRP